METWLVSGSDTGIGKTWVMGRLVASLRASGVASVQVIKPVETGVSPDQPGDAPTAVGGDQADEAPTRVTHLTLQTFSRPLAPVEAALAEGEVLSCDDLVAAVRALPPVGVRLVEGAGGLAVPLEASGVDWADFALRLGVDRVLLVVENRLGAIHQARLLTHYATARGLPWHLILNQVRPQPPEVLAANAASLARLELTPWATLPPNRPDLLPIGSWVSPVS